MGIMFQNGDLVKTTEHPELTYICEISAKPGFCYVKLATGLGKDGSSRFSICKLRTETLIFVHRPSVT